MNYIEQLLLRQSQLWRMLLTGEEREEQKEQEPRAGTAAERAMAQREMRREPYLGEQAGFAQAAGEQGYEKAGFPNRRLIRKEDGRAERKAGPQEPKDWEERESFTGAAPPQGGAPADFSRQIQRDARRYDGGYALY
ncbi:hypothetical protein KQI82_04940 [Oscillibacter sp. MSJ-2]|uniref:Uncharacterized protein n=1 Tax=Dysosmobacter acutus TaxID=2841504 RepID=A0ABS6F7L9_9FIRM|nr:hypothetical protein [Dysosmobacter acutus]MBU5626267.1 hypothetical protein [Dysosmobacter acutus]